MCGRYERRGDKQKIAEAFYAKGGLDAVDFGEDFDCAPGSNQPVVWMNKEGERALGLMRWGICGQHDRKPSVHASNDTCIFTASDYGKPFSLTSNPETMVRCVRKVGFSASCRKARRCGPRWPTRDRRAFDCVCRWIRSLEREREM